MNRRQLNIIKLLIQDNEYYKVENLADKFGVTKRTIFSDLKTIEENTKIQKLILQRDRNKGIKLIQQIEEDKKDTKFNPSLIDRRLQILAFLLFKKNLVTNQSLSEYFYVSVSTIFNDIEFIRQAYLSENTAELKSSKKGTYLSGNEAQFQNTYMKFNELIINDVENDHLIKIDYNNREKYQIYSNYYGEEITTSCIKVLFDYINLEVNKIAEYYLDNVLNSLIILTYRVNRGFHMDDEYSSLTNKFLDDAKQICEIISKKLSVGFYPKDIEYFSTILKGNKAGRTINDDTKYIKNFIRRISEILEKDLTQDTLLLNQLKSHFPAMIFRLKNGIHIYNPFLVQIKEDYLTLYHIIWLTLAEMEKKDNIYFTEDEVGFLTIYMQSSLDRNKIAKNILIICPDSIANSGFILNRIREVLPSLDAIHTSRIEDIPTLNLLRFDLIISTEYIAQDEIPVVYISPLVTNTELKKVAKIYNDSVFHDLTYQKKEGYERREYFAKKYFDPQLIFLDQNFKTKSEALDFLFHELMRRDYVDQDFAKSVLIRETKGNTELTSGAAIPHGLPKYVRKSVIAILNNNRSILWKEEMVNYIFLICINQNDFKELKDMLNIIYEIVSSAKSMEYYIRNSNPQETIRRIIQGENSDR